MNSVYSSGAVPAVTLRQWTTVATSAVLHSALVLVIVYAGRVAGVLPEMPPGSLTFVRVVLPDPPRLTRLPVRLPPAVKQAVTREPPIPVPSVEKPPAPERVVARLEPPRPAPEPRPESPAPPDRLTPAPVVQVGGFASASSAPAVPLPRPIEQAGFDTEARASGPKIASAAIGAFEQSAAVGRQRPGNGRPDSVADAGFGTGMAAGPAGRGDGGRVVAAGLDAGTGGGGGPRAPQAVKATDFDARAAQPSAPKVSREAHAEVPVEILLKPTPEYTDEARALKIEGEVALEVEFAATGEIRVLKVVRSLGHGLDECAARAVQGMRFRPARRAGQPIDVRTTVNIVFRLA